MQQNGKKGKSVSVFDNYFPLGLGTTRLPIKRKDDFDGIEISARIIARAINLGVNYIDTSYLYARGAAHSALKIAFEQTDKPVAVTCKLRYGDDYTSDDARRRIERSLLDMGLDFAEFACVWTVMDFAEFEYIMRKGGLYDGIQKAKEEGLIRHIIFSTHASQEDVLRIIASGVFEGVTISLSPLNWKIMKPVIDAAKQKNIGIAAMNPLSGGLIPNNAEYFGFLKGNGDASVTEAALRYVKAMGADIVLSGCASIAEVEENIRAFAGEGAESACERIERVNIRRNEAKSFCTGCGYCVKINTCPADIDIPVFMQSRNMLELEESNGLAKLFNRTDKDLLKSMSVFKFMREQFSYTPDMELNPCVKCGKCETVCTQKLDICAGIEDIYQRAAKAGFSVNAQNARVRHILAKKDYKRVGVYPNTMQAGAFVDVCERTFGKDRFEWAYFNTDPKMQRADENPVYGPHDIPKLGLDIIVIVNYRYDREIYNAIKPVCDDCGVDLAILFDGKDDLPFVFN